MASSTTIIPDPTSTLAFRTDDVAPYFINSTLAVVGGQTMTVHSGVGFIVTATEQTYISGSSITVGQLVTIFPPGKIVIATNTSSIDSVSTALDTASSTLNPESSDPLRGGSDTSAAKKSLNSLSIGAKVGIGVGITMLFLVFTAFLALFFFRYGKRSAQVRYRPNPPTPPPKNGPSRPVSGPIDPLSCRIEDFPQEPYELWSPAMSDLEKKGSTELEGCQVEGLVETKKGKRAELDGRTRRWGSGLADGERERKSESGNWLSNWSRWVDRV